MFLDDELLEICEKADIKSYRDVQITINAVHQRCLSYLNENIRPTMFKVEALTVMNRSFKLFDLFVEKLKNHRKPEVHGFYFYFVHNTFKKVFLSTKNGKKMYEDCLEFKTKTRAQWN